MGRENPRWTSLLDLLMRIRSTVASIVLMLPVFAVPLLTSFALGEEPDPLSFNRDVRPILSDNCFGCHGPAEKDVKAGLQLHSFESATALLGKGEDRQALVPGDRKASELWKRITSRDPDEKMPPPDSNHRLTPGQIEVLGQWIDPPIGRPCCAESPRILPVCRRRRRNSTRSLGITNRMPTNGRSIGFSGHQPPPNASLSTG